ncbi:uncharacterized protein LOC127833841 [Dreissena polymorpha]|uniref:uncharacterized protein LOC127833841 n=1 Tax=Dreissena polymorpha TaxID=45954 RepID=UPI002263F756|nr:uncharacterized protein LOC127833841 [Dreissena polymorpha]
MPTSSQALILKKGVLTEDEVRPTSSGHWPGSQCSVPTGVRSGPQYAFRTPVHCSIVTVYNFGQGPVGGGVTTGPRRYARPWARVCAALQASTATEGLHQHPRIRPRLEILSVTRDRRTI